MPPPCPVEPPSPFLRGRRRSRQTAAPSAGMRWWTGLGGWGLSAGCALVTCDHKACDACPPPIPVFPMVAPQPAGSACSVTTWSPSPSPKSLRGDSGRCENPPHLCSPAHCPGPVRSSTCWRPCPSLAPALTLLAFSSPQLYAELRRENERLREALTETTLRLAQLKVELERATQVRVPGCSSRGQRTRDWASGLGPELQLRVPSGPSFYVACHVPGFRLT